MKEERLEEKIEPEKRKNKKWKMKERKKYPYRNRTERRK